MTETNIRTSADYAQKQNKKDSMDMKDVKTNLNYDDKVIQKIAGLAINGVSGILDMDGGMISSLKEKITNSDEATKGVDTEVGKKQVAVELNVICEFNKNIPDIFNEATEKISEKIKDMTGLEVIEVTMNVSDIMTREEYDEKHKNDKKEQKKDEKQAI